MARQIQRCKCVSRGCNATPSKCQRDTGARSAWFYAHARSRKGFVMPALCRLWIYRGISTTLKLMVLMRLSVDAPTVKRRSSFEWRRLRWRAATLLFPRLH